MTLHVITPISRPKNLPALYKSLCDHLPMAWRWWCIFDRRVKLPPKPPQWRDVAYWGYAPEGPSVAGYGQRNFALDQILDGWIYFLDDDNLIHPRLIPTWSEAIREYPQAWWFIFRQVRPNGAIYLRATCPPRINHVDIGQSMIHRKVIGAQRFENQYCADGILFERLAQQFEPVCVDVEATFYNALRVNDGGQAPP